jgi:queuine tRNA-ribosyltransferase
VFGIVQGSTFDDLRRESATDLVALDFPGYAIGGVAVGEGEPEMLQQVAATAPHLPVDKPRYTMGLGTPPQRLKMLALGVDMFDCELPTRLARNGAAFTPRGVINLRNEKYRRSRDPLVTGLDNYTCRNFTMGYLRHLIMAGEILGSTLLTLHNVHFYLDLMRQSRAHLEAGDFTAWSRAWIAEYDDGGRREAQAVNHRPQL